MQRHGVRFWPRGEPLPPELATLSLEAQPPLGNPEYAPAGRLILLPPSVKAAHVRHELGHALDDLMDERRLVRLDDLSAGERRAKLESQVSAYGASETNRRFEVTVAGHTERLTMAEMFTRYRERAPYREQSFDGRGVTPGHTFDGVTEFFAEGVSVFNGDDLEAQARLLRRAPELYAWLEDHNVSHHQPVPDRALLERLP